MGGRPCFSCAPGHETLAAELAELVDGTWETIQGIPNVMIMANGATVPGALPAPASDEALAWWHKSVTTTLARTPDRRNGASLPGRAPSNPVHKGERN
jgi:hypothetical protein